MADRQIHVSRIVDAPARSVFALLRDPRRHPEVDGSGTLRDAPDAVPLGAVGEKFVMNLHAEDLGSYQTCSVVVRFEPDRAIAWSPAPVDGEPLGHVFTYVLEQDAPDRTKVTQTYDWSGVDDPGLDDYLPRVSEEELDRTLELLAEALVPARDAG